MIDIIGFYSAGQADSRGPSAAYTRLAFLPLFFGFRAFAFARARFAARSQCSEKFFRGRSNGVDGASKRDLIRFGRSLHAAHFAHVLQSGVVNLFVGRRRLEMMQNPNVAAHAREDTPGQTSAPSAIFNVLCERLV